MIPDPGRTPGPGRRAAVPAYPRRPCTWKDDRSTCAAGGVDDDVAGGVDNDMDGTGPRVSDNQNLLAEQRRALILDEVRRRGGVRVNELTRRLNVSDMTVRRDLDALARQGVVEKVHGGAVPVVEASSHEPGFEAKSGLELGAKEAIARAAADWSRRAAPSRSPAAPPPSPWPTTCSTCPT